MKINKKFKIVLLIVFLILTFFFFFKFFLKRDTSTDEQNNIKLIEKNKNYNSNIILNVKYATEDSKGNKYIINANQGEIDLSNSNIIFLTDVDATIEMLDSSLIKIKSNFGKYNINNYDTIFSKNVSVEYLDNKIIGEYLDFSLKENLLNISKEVIYSNNENILFADAIELNIKTKDTIIFMYEQEKQVKVKSKN